MTREIETFSVGDVVRWRVGGTWSKSWATGTVTSVSQAGTVTVARAGALSPEVFRRGKYGYRNHLAKETAKERAQREWRAKWRGFARVRLDSEGFVVVSHERLPTAAVDDLIEELQRAKALLEERP